LNAWRTFVQHVATNYPLSKGIEIWNEPNSAGFWGGCSPSADRYVELFKYASEGIANSANPNIPIILGSPAPHAGTKITPPPGVTSDDHIKWQDWLDQVFTIGDSQYPGWELSQTADILGLHPYRNGAQYDPQHPADALPFDEAALEQYDEAKLSHDPPGIPIWVTEVGVTTTVDPAKVNSPPPSYVGPIGGVSDPTTLEPAQAAADKSIYLALRNRGVPVVIVHRFIDDTSSSAKPPEKGWGVLGSGLRRKAAYCALATVRGLSPSCP
jgi:hypothetical protein